MQALQILYEDVLVGQDRCPSRWIKCCSKSHQYILQFWKILLAPGDCGMQTCHPFLSSQSTQSLEIHQTDSWLITKILQTSVHWPWQFQQTFNNILGLHLKSAILEIKCILIADPEIDVFNNQKLVVLYTMLFSFLPKMRNVVKVYNNHRRFVWLQKKEDEHKRKMNAKGSES